MAKWGPFGPRASVADAVCGRRKTSAAETMRDPTAEIGRGPRGSRKAVGGGAAAIARNDRAWAYVQGWTGAAVAVIDRAGAPITVIDWADAAVSVIGRVGAPVTAIDGACAAEVMCYGHVAGRRSRPSKAGAGVVN